MAITGERIEETFEEAQCPKALDARQTWWCICKSNLSVSCPNMMMFCMVHLFRKCTLFDFLINFILSV